MQPLSNVEETNSHPGHSTGPRTEQGKAHSSQNAVKHGLFAKTIFIQGESQEEFDRHYNHLPEPKDSAGLSG